jgi:hypothetical protein
LAAAPSPTRSWPGCGPTSRSSRARCAGGTRWSTSTRVRPRTSRVRCSTPGARTSTSAPTRPCTAVPTSSPRREPTPTSPPAATIATVHRGSARRGRLHAERHRGDQPGRLRLLQRRARGWRRGRTGASAMCGELRLRGRGLPSPGKN